jgi:hypothetical protein
MKIGILSDSHGRHLAVRHALAALESLGAEAFVHCGDVGGMAVFDELAGRAVHFVWGNTDVPDAVLEGYVEDLGLTLPNVPLSLTLGGKRIAVCHGHERCFERVILAAEHDYLFCGHTHERCDRRENGMRIINPGALHRARIKTVATLDLSTDELTFYAVDDSRVAPLSSRI